MPSPCIFFDILGRVTGFPKLSAIGSGLPSGFAVAPKVASAARGPGTANLAGNFVQSRPRPTHFILPLKLIGKKKAAPLLKRPFLYQKNISGLLPICRSFFELQQLRGKHRFRWLNLITKPQFGFCP
jgi:hypothetical protein